MNAKNFLQDAGFLIKESIYEDMEYAIAGEMKKGLAGEGGLPMLPSYLPVTRVKEPCQVIVLDVGGTNLRTALVAVAPGEPVQVKHLTTLPTPGTQGPMTRETFFAAIAETLRPIAGASDRIGLCFSFACDILPDRDARVLYLDKQLQVTGLTGTLVGEGLREAMASLGLPHDHRITVLNDTVAALLGAVATDPTPFYDGYIGMILGTGFNCCYNEANVLVTKDKVLQSRPGRFLMNTECGGFTGFPITDIDRKVHAACADGAKNALEKALSGAYQGPLLTELLKAAAAEDVFHADVIPTVTAKDACDFLLHPDAPGVLHDLCPDPEPVLQLTRGMIHRASCLVAVTLRAILRRGYMGLRAPACLAVEGTTFWRNTVLRESIMRQVVSGGRTIKLVSVEDANLAGAAAAALAD